MSTNNFAKSLLLHIKYPYTAIIIALVWISIAIIIGLQPEPQSEFLFLSTAATSLIIASIGFSSPK